MKPKSTLLPFLALAGSSLLAMSSASAQFTYYWNQNDTTAGWGTGGTWNTSSAVFSTTNSDTASAGTATTGTADTLNIGTSTVGFAGGTIGLGSTTQSIGTIATGSANTTADILINGGTLTFAASGTITNNSPRGLIIDAVVGSAGATTRLDLNANGGDITMSGSANTYTGITYINSGTVVTNNAASLGASGTDANRTVVASGARLLFNNTPRTYTERFEIAGAGVGGSTGALSNAQNSTTLNGQISLSSAATIHNSAGTLTMGGGIVLGGNTLTLNVAGGTQTVQTTGISGNGAIVKSGAGNLNLNAASTYTGLTTVSAGILTVGNNNALGSSAAGSNNTTVAATGSSSNGRIQVSNGISTAENITITGATEANQFLGAIYTPGTATLSGTITLAGSGGIRLGGGQSSYTGSTINWTGTITQSSTSHTLLFVGNNVVSNAMTINGANLTIANSGTAGTRLDAVNGSGIGDTDIYDATLKLGITNAIRTDRDLTFANTAGVSSRFDMNGYNQTIRGLINSGGTVAREVYNNASSTTSTLTVGNGGGDYSFAGVIRDNTAGTGIVALVKTGTGNQTLTGINTFTGGTQIDNGTLTLGNATNTLTGAINVNGGTLALGTNTDTVGVVTLTSGSITGSGTASQGVLTGTSYDVRSGSVSAKLAGTGVALTKSTSGTVTLTAANTYSGATNVNEGMLHVSGSGSINSSSGITVNGGHFKYNSSTNLTAPLTFTSGTVSGTNLAGVSLSIGTGDTISPGNSPGTMNVANQTWAAGGTYLWELYDATGTAGTGWDLLAGTGTLDITASLGSEFIIDLTTLAAVAPDVLGNAINFNANNNYAWLIADFASVTGFNTTDFTIDATGFTNSPLSGSFGISLGGVGAVPGDSSQVYLTYTYVPEPGAALLGGLGTLLLLRRRRSA